MTKATGKVKPKQNVVAFPRIPQPSADSWDINDTERVDLNEMLMNGNGDPLLTRLQGDSNSNEIKDGDWVMIDRSATCFIPNAIALVKTGDGYTIRRQRPATLRLVGDADAGRNEIVGTVMWMIRSMA